MNGYDNYKYLKDAENLFCSLVVSLLSSDDRLLSPTAVSRLKDKEECIKKFARKYQSGLEEKEESYSIKDYITDLIGVRVICLYEDEIEIVKDILKNNFNVLDITDKITSMECREDAFGYKGLHMDLMLEDSRKTLPEYSRYRDLQFEVQIRTIIQDAWSVLDHKIKYKKSIPTNLKRRINVLAALFELSDHEFMSIREETEKLRREAEEKRKSETAHEEAALDVFQFLEISKQFWPKYDFYDFKADGFVEEIIKLNPEITANEYESILKLDSPSVSNYAEWLEAETSHYMNPYTQIRHFLYLSDKEKYKMALFDRQRTNFEKWIEQGEPKVEREDTDHNNSTEPNRDRTPHR